MLMFIDYKSFVKYWEIIIYWLRDEKELMV